jgi:hypothetical protein
MSNPYTERACALMKWREGEEPFTGIPLPPTPMASAEAQVNATLALAYEQRTANLISVMADGETNGVMPEIDYNEVAKQIKERLEL